jgi:hypothetical protein
MMLCCNYFLLPDTLYLGLRAVLMCCIPCLMHVLSDFCGEGFPHCAYQRRRTLIPPHNCRNNKSIR